jgi:hypothetical protein
VTPARGHGLGRARLRSFLLGGVAGGVVAVVAPRVRGPRPPAGEALGGLEAFEGAPCFRHDVERAGSAAARDAEPARRG